MEDIKRRSFFSEYKRNNSIFRKYAFKAIPGFILSNLTTFLFVEWDGIIVGNVNGSDSLAAITAMHPIILFVSVLGLFICYGVSDRIAELFGQNDRQKLRSCYKATMILFSLIAIASVLVKIPITRIALSLLGLGEEVYNLTWSYAIPLIIATPFSFLCSLGTYVLTVNGKSKNLFALSIAEGITDVSVDFLLVVYFKMGVVGAGIGTLVGVFVRAMITAYYFKKIGVFDFSHEPWKDEAKIIVKYSYPRAVAYGLKQLISYFLAWLIADMLGVEGVAVKGVIALCTSVLSVLPSAIANAASPVIGIKYGAGDLKGAKSVQREALCLTLGILGAMMAFICIFPELPFKLYGFSEISREAIIAVCIAVFASVDETEKIIGTVFTLNERGKNILYTNLIVKFIVTVPIGLLLRSMGVGAFIWIILPLQSFAILVIESFGMMKINKKNRKITASSKVLYLSLKSNKVTELNAITAEFFRKNGVESTFSNKVQLCMEEMAAYERRKSKFADVEFTVTFGDDRAIITMIDNGDPIELTDTDKNIISNMETVKRISSDYEYQRKLDCNIFTTYITKKEITV